MGGSAPYGYDYIRKTKDNPARYRVNEEQAKHVRLIYSLYLKLRSTTKVIKELAKLSIRAKNGSQYWAKGLIYRILTSECYIGTTYYNKHDKGGGKWRVRERDDWIPIKVPPIVDEEIFRLAGEILKSHRGGKRKRIYILSGLIRCKHCGSRYIGTSTSTGLSYYRCANLMRRFPLPRDCFSKPVRADKIEQAVVNAIKTAVLKPDILINHVLRQAEALLERRKNADREKQKLIAKRMQIENKKTRLLDLYLGRNLQQGEYLQKKVELEEMEKELEKKREGINRDVPCIDKPSIIQNVRHFCELAKERLEQLQSHELQEFLRYLIDDVIFERDNMKATILGHIPTMKNRDVSTDDTLFHFPSRLSGETWNKKLKFELEVRV